MKTNWGISLGAACAVLVCSVSGVSLDARLAIVIYASLFFGIFYQGGMTRVSFRSVPDASYFVYKSIGLSFLSALAYVAYLSIPEYHKPLYQPFFRFVSGQWDVLLLIVSVYVVVSSLEKSDSAYCLGRFLLARQSWDFACLNAIQSTAVKAFFLPLMISFLNTNIGELVRACSAFDLSLVSVVSLVTALCFFVDLSTAVSAYMFGCSGLKSSIRSVQPVFLGLFVALICYQPFWPAISSFYFPYEDGIKWTNAFAGHPLLMTVWAAAICVCLFVYAWATAAMGFRFANLCNKGLVDWGPYRYVKHPAYLSKNLYWWLVSVPWISTSPTLALQHCAMLAGINFIYYWRARTEEQHLSESPEFRLYFSRMNASRALIRRYAARVFA